MFTPSRRFLFLLLCACAVSFGQKSSPLSFEVASVRPTVSRNIDSQRVQMSCNGGPGTSDPERLACTNAPLKMLICIAYQLQYYQVSGPGWMDTDGYEISAKVPRGTSKESYREMLQALLSERFKLTFHHQSKVFTTYSLREGKGGNKLQAFSNGTRGERDIATPGLTVANMNGNLHVSARAQSLANLAGFLSTTVALGSPVRDKTGLGGLYDFTLDFTPETALDSGATGTSLFAALESQLGLKIEAEKTPLDVLVIDHAERLPIQN